VYLSSIDQNNGDKILANEVNVRSFLENILENPEDYNMSVYERCGVNFQIKRTKLVSHSYYAITNLNDGEYHTLSFYGTKIAFYSEGAWALDTDSDLSSYISLLKNDNIWDVAEIETSNGIDTEKTVRNIIKKIDSDITYYYRDHIKNRSGVENCNTALWDTLVEKGKK
jgi:hypothetical protein